MKDSIRRKLEKLDERFEEISRLLSDAGVIARQNQFRELSMEYSRLGPLVERYRRFIALERDFGFARELAHRGRELGYRGAVDQMHAVAERDPERDPQDRQQRPAPRAVRIENRQEPQHGPQSVLRLPNYRPG